MEWKVGFKLTHPFNQDWGIGDIVEIGKNGRNLKVLFSKTQEQITFSTHAATFHRWHFPVGSRAKIINGELLGTEVVLVEKFLENSPFDHYQTTDGNIVCEKDLQPLDYVAGPIERLQRLDVDTIEQYENRYACMALDMKRQAHGFAGMLGARVDLFSHQLHVAFQVARKFPVRALLADEVGLGKTIEAGLIYSALRQANRASRVLVITPESLSIQWLGELYRKFHDIFVIVDEERIADATQDHPNISPWSIYPKAICSFSFLLANPMCALDASEIEAGWDLLIVDEAHHIRYKEDGSNDLYQTIEDIAAKSKNILFLTATPMELDRKEYFGLLKLIQPDLFHDFDLFELQLEEISRANGIAASLEAALGESPDDDELEATKIVGAKKSLHPIPDNLLEQLEEFFPDQPELLPLVNKIKSKNKVATQNLLKFLTNLHPLGDSVYSNTRARVGGFPPRKCDIFEFEFCKERMDIYRKIQSWVFSMANARKLTPKSNEAKLLFSLLRLATCTLSGLKNELIKWKKHYHEKEKVIFFEEIIEACDLLINEDNPKLDTLLIEIKKAISKSEKVLVFVHNLQDLLHLKDRIEARVGVRVSVFHEWLSATERDLQVAMFRTPDGYPVLLSTESGGEGRNFQFCHRLIHYDLPSSPNRVEQRIGRLDRIGQSHEVHSVVLVTKDTIEKHVAEFFHNVVGVFNHTIGGLDPVLEEIGDNLVSLSLKEESLNIESWQELAKNSIEKLNGARDAITRGLDHLLHRGGYNEHVTALLDDIIQQDMESLMEECVLDFCEQVGISIQEKESHNAYVLSLDRYCTIDGLPGVSIGSNYLGTFSREDAVEHETFDFLSTGHPFIEGIFSYIKDTPYGTSALRMYKKTGLEPHAGIICNYIIEVATQKNIDASYFFPPQMFSVAVSLDGTVKQEVIPILTARFSKARPLAIEDMQRFTSNSEWLDRAYEMATSIAKEYWNKVSQESISIYDEYRYEEEQKLETYFEHRMDFAEAKIAFSENPRLAKAAQVEFKLLEKEWKRRKSILQQQRSILKEGSPILDSVSFYWIKS